MIAAPRWRGACEDEVGDDRKVAAMSSVDATASGLPYLVVMVGGEMPASLEQFVGEASFTVSKSGTESSVSGFGALHETEVRFQEKGLRDGKDVRVWHIRQTADGTYTAETISSF
jgi:hypothetical protein